VPVPVPMQPVDWYRAPSGEVQYYYTMGYPSLPADGSSAASSAANDQSSRRNSVESFQSKQASSTQEAISEASSTASSTVNSENGGSPQGPASPQGDAPGALKASGVVAGSCDDHKMAAVAAGAAGAYVYPCAYPPYGMAPPVFAAGY